MPKINNQLPISFISWLFWLISLVLILLLVNGCSSLFTPTQTIETKILVDNQIIIVDVQYGEKVADVLNRKNVILNNLDRVEPQGNSEIKTEMEIKVVRVTEEFEVEEITVPFSQQTVKNESLPEGQTLIIQPGKNGKKEITHRLLFENGEQVSRTIARETVMDNAQAEIIMVGVQSPFSPVTIPGKLAYLSAGNAWVIEGNTGERRPVVTTGDLDGRIFNLSPESDWLLFTRKSELENEINSLWLVNLLDTSSKPISLQVKNVVHFADWVPNEVNTIAYSTVEPRSTPPGWQANNDLVLVEINKSGYPVGEEVLIDANSGGIYGWWGTTYTWSNGGNMIIYARPDSIGQVNTDSKELVPLFNLIPVETGSDWAWIPGIGFSSDDSTVFLTNHAPASGLTRDEDSPRFDLVAWVIEDDYTVSLVPETGMFSYPEPAPYPDENFLVAFLQAAFPEKSDTSRYRLVVMDRDGSNKITVFPSEGSTGIEPQKIAWSPWNTDKMERWIGLINQGNLWLINVDLDQEQQISGDGSIIRIDWK